MKWRALALMCVLPFLLGADECTPTQPVSSSGVSRATVKIETGSDGLTAEQRNISGRLKEDNRVGAIKHLYVMSSYSGQVLLYSTVRGKVTSGNKRLQPSTVVVGDIGQSTQRGFSVAIGGAAMETNEVLGDDGAYGTSGDYLYWWDTSGRYFQIYITGGMIPIVSSQPLAAKSVVLNLGSD